MTSPVTREDVAALHEAYECFARGHEFIEVGDSMVVVSTQRGQLKDTESVIDRPCVDVWTFRDGRIVSHDAYLDREDALRAVRAGARA